MVAVIGNGQRTLVDFAEPVSVRKANHRLMLSRMTASVRSTVGWAPRTNRLTPAIHEALYRQEPLLKRGIRKHSGDLVKHWCRLVDTDGEEHSADAEFQSWCREHRVQPKFREAIKAGHIYGDGLFEYEVAGSADEASDDPVPDFDGNLVEVHVVDPVHVRFQPFRDDDGEVRYTLNQTTTGQTVTLHPDRFGHFRLDTLPGYIGGISTVEAAYHSALSKVKGDQGIGEILYHAGVPFRFGGIKDATDKEVQAVFEMLNDPDFQRGAAWDDRLKIDQLNPEGVDPEPYYTVLETSIAAAIGIPVMMLKGAQAGAVTGSETNLADYHADLREVQENVLTPIVQTIVAGSIGLTPDAYEVEWYPFPEDPLREAQKIENASRAWERFVSNGVDPVAAARIAGIDLTEKDMIPLQPTISPNEARRAVRGQEEGNVTEGDEIA